MWVPSNLSPMVRAGDKFLFRIRSDILLQINASEVGFATV